MQSRHIRYHISACWLIVNTKKTEVLPQPVMRTLLHITPLHFTFTTGPFLTCKLGATAPLVIRHIPPSDLLWPTSKLVGGGGISRSIMFELYSHILDYKLQYSNGVCAPSLAKWNKQ